MPLRRTLVSIIVSSHFYRQALPSMTSQAPSIASLHPPLCGYLLLHIICHFTPCDALRDAYICHPKIFVSFHQKSILSSTNSIFSQTPSAPSSDASLSYVPTPQVDTSVILSPVVLPTPPTSMSRLLIMTQLTRHAYNFSWHNCTAWVFSFELFLASHRLMYHLTDDPPPLHSPCYAPWLQSDSTIIPWMLHSTQQSIFVSLVCIKPMCCL